MATGLPGAREQGNLVPINEVARRFGLPASTIRYYEERGLVEPVSRHSGRRWYGAAELRRLAVIRYWQRAGLMSLDDIALILAGSDEVPRWRVVVDRHVRTLETQIAELQTAKEFLEHVASHHESSPDGCPHYEAEIWASLTG
jgi:MerR family transcriptional regulator, copper efflux regulator